MSFQTAYEKLLEQHRKNSSPERLRILRTGLGFAERCFLEHVWWPLIGNFTYLHPQYEIADYSGASRFLDFAYLRGGIKLAIEIDGFTSHAKNLDRRQFTYHLRRQNLLTLDGWDILRFAFDEIESHPRWCQRTIQQYMGSRFATNLYSPTQTPRVTAVDREIVRLARSLPRPILPNDVQKHLGVSRSTVYRHIRRLVARGWLLPASGSKRIRSYELHESVRQLGV